MKKIIAKEPVSIDYDSWVSKYQNNKEIAQTYIKLKKDLISKAELHLVSFTQMRERMLKINRNDTDSIKYYFHEYQNLFKLLTEYRELIISIEADINRFFSELFPTIQELHEYMYITDEELKV